MHVIFLNLLRLISFYARTKNVLTSFILTNIAAFKNEGLELSSAIASGAPELNAQGRYLILKIQFSNDKYSLK